MLMNAWFLTMKLFMTSASGPSSAPQCCSAGIADTSSQAPTWLKAALTGFAANKGSKYYPDQGDLREREMYSVFFYQVYCRLLLGTGTEAHWPFVKNFSSHPNYMSYRAALSQDDGMKKMVWQVRASHDQKPYRKLMMQTWIPFIRKSKTA